MSISNLKKSVNNSRKISLERLIFSIGIRHIGQENAKILAGFFKSAKEFRKFINLSNRDELLKNLKELDGIGDTQIESMNIFFSNETNKRITLEFIDELEISEYKSRNKNGIFSDKRIMFTGGFKEMSRSEAKAITENSGGKVLGSVSRKLDYLVVGDSKPTKKKVDKAKDLNIKILTEKEWRKILNN